MTKELLTSKIHSSQRLSSRQREHPMPEWNLEELREWIYSQPNFENLFESWVDSNYNSDLVPSVDRIEDSLPYTFSNITLTTWKENRDSGYKNRKNNGSGWVMYSNYHKAFIARIQIDGKQVQIKSSKDEQICIEALKEYNHKLK